jgi:ADP-ribose pyrophosphatase
MQNSPTSDQPIQKWETLTSEPALSERWFPVRKDMIKLPSGKVISDYFVWESPTIVTTVPITTDGKFVLCQQYRHAVNEIMYQFPAGGMDRDEATDQTALRELEEETGYKAASVELLTKVAAYATKASGWNYLYLAQNVTPTGIKHDDESEPTRIVLKTPDELWDLIANNEFQGAGSLAAALLVLKRLENRGV